MQKFIFSSLMSIIAFTSVHATEIESDSQQFGSADSVVNEVQVSQPIVQAAPKPAQAVIHTAPFTAFTGKITRNKVRERIQPSLDGAIIRELSLNDLVMVVGETDEFYAVEPPADLKAYIFRTYVLDGTIEGNHVNVRLEPDLAAPVIAQLNSGDTVKGSISNIDKKWLEIAPPTSTRLYVSKEYVEKVGDAGMMASLKRRREEVAAILNTAQLNSQIELQKPFDQIHLDGINQKLNLVITKYTDFPNQVTKAKELLASIQTAYLSRKVAYMESQNQSPKAGIEPTDISANPSNNYLRGVNKKMEMWLPAEHAFYEEWKTQNGESNLDDYYKHQEQDAITLHGIVEPYNRSVKNKPGDYVLTSQTTHLPIAYLYSTKINLQDRAGEEITIKAAKRNNHNFAYPAYFVLSLE